jgi:hypothetical protein
VGGNREANLGGLSCDPSTSLRGRDGSAKGIEDEIYIDGMLFRHAGIGRIYQNLLDGLVESAEISRIYTVVPTPRKEEFLRKHPSDKIEAKFTDLSFNYTEYFRKGLLIQKFKPRPDIHYFPYHDVPYFLKESSFRRSATSSRSPRSIPCRGTQDGDSDIFFRMR